MTTEQSSKAGWRPTEWGADVGISRSQTYELLATRAIDSVKIGSARIITTSPRDYLASLRMQAGSETHAANAVARFDSEYPSDSASRLEPEAA